MIATTEHEPAISSEVMSVLDDELQELPSQYRGPMVQCYMLGRSRPEAAAQLGISEGSLKGKLERGRELLRMRLMRRGIALTLLLLTGILEKQSEAMASVPDEMVKSLAQSAGRFANGQDAGNGSSANAVAMAEGALREVALSKVKVMAVAAVVVAIVSILMAMIGGPTRSMNAGGGNTPAVIEKAKEDSAREVRATTSPIAAVSATTRPGAVVPVVEKKVEEQPLAAEEPIDNGKKTKEERMDNFRRLMGDLHEKNVQRQEEKGKAGEK